ncbi:flippase [Metabacillus bambusae]|uniref:Flippase n=1 Tax=Metabacillus bambusae TaxID=2795218 RepID=A0ABS3N0U8_9BACI|nr:flippase [Metabacillus bambusae]MBO1511893.1 flippase [Metabacillus bambusae]
MFKNIYLMFVTLGFRLLSNVAIFFILARFWSVDVLGDFMYLITLSSILILVSDYGFNIRLVKEISSDPSSLKKYLYQSFFAKVFLTLFLLIGIIFYFEWVDQGSVFKEEEFYILFLSYIFNSFSNFFMLPLRAIGRFDIESKHSTISNLLLFVGVSIGLFLVNTPMEIAIIYLVARLISFIYGYFLLYKVIGNFFIFKFKLNIVVLAIKNNFSYAIHLIVGTLYFQVDSLIVHYYAGGHGLGIYQAATRIVFALLMISEVLCNVYLPKLSLAFKENNEKEYIKSIKVMFRYNFIIAIALSFVIKFFPAFLVNTLFDEEFIGAIVILELLSIVLFLRFLSSALGVLLTIQNTQSYRAIAVIVALILNILFSVFLIPKFGLIGAVYANIVSNFVLLIIYLFVIKNTTIFIINKRNMIVLIVVLLILIY